MPKAFAAVFALLLLAAHSAAAPPALDIPTEVRPANGYATVRPKTEAKAVSYVGLDGVFPFPSDLLADKRMFVLPAQGLAAGRYRFVAVGSLNDEHAVVEFAVVVGNAPVPPTPPGPQPPPVPPLDPLAAKFRDAFKSSNFTRSRDLAIGLDACAKVVTEGQTAGAFFTAAKAMLKSAMDGQPLPAAVQTILTAETAAVLPTDPAAKVPAAETVGLYTRLAAAVRAGGAQ